MLLVRHECKANPGPFSGQAGPSGPSRSLAVSPTFTIETPVRLARKNPATGDGGGSLVTNSSCNYEHGSDHPFFQSSTGSESLLYRFNFKTKKIQHFNMR